MNSATRPGIPPDKAERDRLRAGVDDYVAREGLVPPLSIEELRAHATRIAGALDVAGRYGDFTTLLIGNAIWRDTLAAIPYDRRVLLLPQCLRDKAACRAEMDELGVLCQQCGRCAIGGIQAEAERLGYVVLVAEGTTVVMKLLESGKVDAVVGVSCLSVLEKAFPHLSAHAIPGHAIPLLRDGCDRTAVDEDWVLEAVRRRSDGPRRGWLDLDKLRAEVGAWFEPAALRDLLALSGTETERMAVEWLARSGKRWRPLLAAVSFRALNGLDSETPDAVRRLAVAVECFHKASLVHDDIEDGDDTRYGEPTLHRQCGVPIALNVGDFLLGEGYRLIAECGADGDRVARMMRAATEGHRDLCLGQGEELRWVRDRRPIAPREVLDVFRRKTSPAFAVALGLGALAGGADDETCAALRRFSESLGIAYQIRDDLRDFAGDGEPADAMAQRLSYLTAAAYEAADPDGRAALAAAWEGRADAASAEAALRQLVASLGVEEKARRMMEHYKRDALRSLAGLRQADLKQLLHRITSRILGA